MILSKCKTIFLSLFCILTLHLVLTSSREPEPSDYVGHFDYSAKLWMEKCVGVKQIQKEINERVTGSQPFDGEKILKKLEGSIKHRLTERLSALLKLKKAIERDADETNTEEQVQCCNLKNTDVVYNSRYKTKINPGYSCELRSKHSHKHARGLGPSVFRTMHDNLKENHLLKWQYFGSAEGVTTIFPSTPAMTCGNYDNRVRPWYVNTVSSPGKHVVILLDTSNSMASPVSMGTKMTTVLALAKEAVTSLLSSLSPKDLVTVVLFNTQVVLPPSLHNVTCFSEMLAKANVININHLKNFVNEAKPGGGTLYNQAFKTVSKMMKHSRLAYGHWSQTDVILFITDGPPKDSKDSIIREMRDLTSTFKARILTYGIGTNPKMKDFLARLDKETGTVNIPVENVLDLHNELPSYYKHLYPTQDRSSYNNVPPYMDEWGLGVITTITMSCYRNGRFLGVAAIDIPLTDLLYDLQYFTQGGPDSLAFMFYLDSQRRVLYHPMLTPPEAVIKYPTFVSLSSLVEEFSLGLDEDMRRSLPLGGSREEGVAEVVFNTNIYSSTMQFDLAFCIVLVGDNVDASIQDHDAKDVIYHRMDLVPQGDACLDLDALSYQDRSVVHFSARAYRQPLDYLDFKESLENVTKLLYLINHNTGKTMFQRKIVKTSRMSGFLDKIWVRDLHVQDYCQDHVPRKYFGTYNGVLRFFPGQPLPTNYDHTKRPWYLKARANPDELIFTTPYADPLGAGIIVTVSQAITMVTTKANKTTVFGVAAADWSISYLANRVRNNLGFPCKDIEKTTCFLIDTAGFIVFHPRFVQRNVYDNVAMVKGKHITEMHGHIASVLVDNGIMTKRKCRDVENRQIQLFYKIRLRPEGIYRPYPTRPGRCDKFAFKRLDNTNLFVVAAFSYDPSKMCDISEACSCGPACTKDDQDYVCECPCTKKKQLNYCLMNEGFDRTIPICSSTMQDHYTRPPLTRNATDLNKCFELKCEELESESACARRFGCAWCKWDEDTTIETPFCTYESKCYGGVKGRRNPFLRLKKIIEKSKSSDQFPIPMRLIIMAGSLAAIVILTTILCSVMIYRFRKRKIDKEILEQTFSPPEAHEGFVLTQMHAAMQDGYAQEAQNMAGNYQGNQQMHQHIEQPVPESDIFDDF